MLHKIDLIFFANPYGNTVRLAIYQWCRKVNFPYIVYERGALVNSWFFDSNGFNADSKSYDISLWNKRLTLKEKDDIKDWMQRAIFGDTALEK